MEKDRIIKAINKYYLNGQCNGAVLKIKDNILDCNFITTNEQCVGFVEFRDFNFQDSVLGLGETSSFLQLLRPFDNDIRFKIEGDENNSSKILMSDGNFNSRYYLFDKSVIPQVEIDEQGLGDVTLKWAIDNQFVTNFKKSKEAISGCTHFAIVSDSKNTRCVINYNQSTNNHILFKFEPEIKEGDTKLLFDLTVFNEIINNNADSLESKVEVFNNCQDFGSIMLLTFQGVDWVSKYYILPKIFKSNDEE